MSSKPSTLPRWASAGGTIVVPPSGKMDVGHLVGEQPAEGHLNWLFNLLYQWMQYLNAPDTQTFTGAVNAASAAITGAITAASAAITGLMSAGQVQTAEADIRHGDRTRIIGTGCCQITDGWAHVGGNTDELTVPSATAGHAYFAVPLAAGDRIKSFRLVCDTPGASGDVVATMYKNAPGIGNASGAAAVSLASATSTATANVQGVTATLGTAYTMAADESVQISVIAANTTGVKSVYALQVTYDRP